MAFKEEWIDSTVHCVDVVSLTPNPTTITNNVEVIFSASVSSTDTFSGSGSVTLTPENGGTPIIGVVGSPTGNIYPVTFAGYTYLTAGSEIATVIATTDSGQEFTKEFAITVN